MLVNHYADCLTQMRQFRIIHGGIVRHYEDVAAALSVTLCLGCDEVTAARHRDGFAVGNTVHWAPRRLNRLGLRRFLKIVAALRIHNYHAYNKAMKLYAENIWAARAAQTLRVRLSRTSSETDRLEVRWLETTGHHLTPEAHRWAHRKETTRVKE